MKLSAVLSVVLATAAVANPAPNPALDVEAVEITAAPMARDVDQALADAACKPNKTCLSDASSVAKCAVCGIP